MTTEASTQLLLQKLLSKRALSSEEREQLETRLATMDDETARALDALEAVDLGLALAEISVPPVAARRRRWLPAMGALAVAASLAVVVSRPPAPPDGLKGFIGAPQVRLLARRGATLDGRPIAAALLSSGERVLNGEAVLFRYRLSEPGWGYLLAQGKGTIQLLHETGWQPRGEHEIAAGGEALALVPSELGQTVIVTLLVSPKRLDGIDGSSLPDLESSTLESACPGCGRHGILLRTEGSP